MANRELKHKKNAPGKWYCTGPDDANEACIACGACFSSAPDFFASDEDGNAYVAKQPQTDDEISQCQDAMDACPVSSIGNDG